MKERNFIIGVCDVLYIEADGPYCKIHYVDDGIEVKSETMGNYLKKLSSVEILRCHKSYAVNLYHVKGFCNSRNMIRLDNGIELKVSRRRKNDVKSKISSLNKKTD